MVFNLLSRGDAEMAMRYINGTRLDDRIIRTDWDAGFIEGRQYGRGKSGGQVNNSFYYFKNNIRAKFLFEPHKISSDESNLFQK